MPLLALSHVAFRYADGNVLEDVSVAVEKGRKIGVIGQNGTGKSTLLRLLAGELSPSDGEGFVQRGARVAYQAQELSYAPGATVRDELRRVFREDIERDARMRELERALSERPDTDEESRLLREYERLQAEQAASKGFDVDARIARMLSSLGLPETSWDLPCEHFSGGERNIIGLAGVLLSRPDAMLLDEPSNHLDMEGVEWFTEFVRGSDAAVVMVSHDRYLLDAVADEIWEIRRGRVTSWTGNYSAFREQKAKALELQERRFKAQQREVERLEFQARRLRDMANAYDDPAQAKKAKAMMRRVEHMDRVERPDRAEDRFRASLSGAKRHGRLALSVRGFDLAFGDRVLFDDARLELEYGERACLVGPNGSGKTTLIRRVLDEGGWEHPTLRLGKSVRIGEYRQLHEDAFGQDERLLEWTTRVTGLTNTPAADLLHRFLFARDDLERPIGTLSGGEKSRLQLARLVHEKVNFLVLDEPTNHLDLQACEQLEEMLLAFEGTLLIVSHDRYFLERLVNRVIEVRDRGLHLSRGSFSEWWEAKRAARERRRKGALELPGQAAGERAEKERARREREERKARHRELHRLQRAMRRLETRIALLEERQAELTRSLETAWAPGADPDEARALSDELAAVRGEVEGLYAEWERVAAQAE